MIGIVEVGPREGLEHESIDVNVACIDALSKAGVREIEVASFGAPAPADVFKRITRAPGVVYSAFVADVSSLERALVAKVGKIACHEPSVIEAAKNARVAVRGCAPDAFRRGGERIDPQDAVEVILRLAGADEISIGDAAGRADANDVRDLLKVLLPVVPASKLVMHFRDTHRHALENALVSWRHGIETFATAVGGAGGCVSTESLVWTFREAGARVDVDLAALAEARAVIAAASGRAT